MLPPSDVIRGSKPMKHLVTALAATTRERYKEPTPIAPTRVQMPPWKPLQCGAKCPAYLLIPNEIDNIQKPRTDVAILSLPLSEPPIDTPLADRDPIS